VPLVDYAVTKLMPNTKALAVWTPTEFEYHLVGVQALEKYTHKIISFEAICQKIFTFKNKVTT